MTQMLALSIIPAYKNENGKAVIEEGTYKKACQIMKDHEITHELAAKYRYKNERAELLKEAEPLKKLRSEFDSLNQELIRQRKLEDAELLGKNAEGMTFEEYKKACEDKRKQELEAEKQQKKEARLRRKQQRLREEEMDKEYVRYLDRITASNKISSARRIELLADYYISGEGKRPVPEEDLEQVQQAAQNKENNPKAAMAK